MKTNGTRVAGLTLYCVTYSVDGGKPQSQTVESFGPTFAQRSVAREAGPVGIKFISVEKA